MLGNIVCDTVILFLLVYAMLDLLTRLVNFLLRRTTRQNFSGHIFRVLSLESGAQGVEWLVRKAVRSAEENGTDLIVLYESVAPEEEAVLDALRREFPWLPFFKKEEYINFILDIEKSKPA